METIFDHGVTKQEKDAIIGDFVSDDFIKSFDAASSNLLIAELYLNRGNKAMTMKYVNRLPQNMKMDFMYRFSKLDRFE